MSQCVHCGSKAFGSGCPLSPSRLHVHMTDEGHCRHCNSTSYGYGCPYSHDKKHNRME